MGQAAIRLDISPEALSTACGGTPRPRPALTTVPISPEPVTSTIDPRKVAQVCESLSWLVLHEARRVAKRLPRGTELDDLVGAGFVGLVMAVQRHLDSPRPVLQRIAYLRVRGAIHDHLRANDHLSRRQRAAVVQLRKHSERLQREKGHVAMIDVAQALGVSEARAAHIQDRFAAVELTHLDDTGALPDDGVDPSSETIDRDIKRQLTEALARLPDRLRTVLRLHYYEGLSYREIGEVLGLADSRVCQLHSQAISTLRRRAAHLHD